MKVITIDPRIKLVLLFITSFFIMVLQNPFILARILIFFFVLLLLRFNLIRSIILIGIMSVSIMLIANIIFLHLNEREILTIILRLLTFISIFLWFHNDLSPEDLSKALIWFRIPYKYSTYISISYRYIFYFRTETEYIMQSLILRGIPLDSHIFSRIRNFHIIIPPLLSRTSFKSHMFSEALFSKNWTPYGGKTFLEPLKFNLMAEIPFTFLWALFLFI